MKVLPSSAVKAATSWTLRFNKNTNGWVVFGLLNMGVYKDWVTLGDNLQWPLQEQQFLPP